LARLTAKAENAWGDQEDACEWLARAHPELGNRAPLDFSATEAGARRVEELLDRLF
jgi:putative toxin-antitoxin system antitoxin component (TIGR02293 family)